MRSPEPMDYDEWLFARGPYGILIRDGKPAARIYTNGMMTFDVDRKAGIVILEHDSVIDYGSTISDRIEKAA